MLSESQIIGDIIKLEYELKSGISEAEKELVREEIAALLLLLEQYGE